MEIPRLKQLRKAKAPKAVCRLITPKSSLRSSEKIYAIQEEYRTKIETARAQLDALLKEEKDKISAVLTEEQKKKVEEFQTAAKAKKGAEKIRCPKNR